MNECTVTSCERASKKRGMCGAHYQRVSKFGDPRAHIPLREARIGTLCESESCQNKRHSLGYCYKHYWRFRKYGSTELPEKTEQPPTRWVTKFGYQVIYIPEHPMANSSGVVLEHRLVMAKAIGRDLRADENIHHVNGDRLDNRLENLELWSRAQPAGQRVADKVRWAIELLKIYQPDLLSAEAMDDDVAGSCWVNVG